MATREEVLSRYKAEIANNRVMGFFGEHRALSNFHEETFTWSGYTWPASENAYMWAKIPGDHDQKEHYANMLRSIPPKEAKILGRSLPLRPDWNKVRVSFMHSILVSKFIECTEAHRVLIGTGSAHLEECNWWNDTFWGTVDGVGSNHLGKLLMSIREVLNCTPQK